MLISNRWQSKTALFAALGMASTIAAPVLLSTPAVANSQSYLIGQTFPRTSSSRLVPAGTTIPVEYDKEKIIVKPDETAPVTLTVAQDISADSERVVIPAGSRIEGELRPAEGGTRFVAKELIIKSGSRTQRFPIDATSEVITDREVITEKTNPDILKGAAIGAAAGAVLAEIFGDIDLGEVLAGAGVGALASTILGGRKEKEVEVVVVRPEQDLDLTLQEDLVLSGSNRSE